MKRNQIIAISACVLLLIAIYFFGNTKKPKEEGSSSPMGQGHAQPQGQQDVEALDINAYIGQVKAQATDKAALKKIESDEKSDNFLGLVEDYKKLDKPLAVAYYIVKQAGVSKTVDYYVTAGDYNAMLMQSAPDEKAKKFLSANTIECYKNAVEMDSTKTDNRIRLAGAYMEQGTQPMQGVLMLLDIVRKDSTNVDAQLMLGRFGLISGQIDKAIARFEKVLYLQPQNSEALFLLAEAYNNQGNKQKALELLEKCKSTVKEPAAKKEIENYIESIKKPKG